MVEVRWLTARYPDVRYGTIPLGGDTLGRARDASRRIEAEA